MAGGQAVTDSSVKSHPGNSQPAVTPPHPPSDSKSQRVAKLIGEKCLLKCNLNGYTVTALQDSGAQVSIIDCSWKQKYLPQQEVRPLSELLGAREFDLSRTRSLDLSMESRYHMMDGLNSSLTYLAMMIPALPSECLSWSVR